MWTARKKTHMSALEALEALIEVIKSGASRWCSPTQNTTNHGWCSRFRGQQSEIERNQHHPITLLLDSR